jgi:hypothetical protein
LITRDFVTGAVGHETKALNMVVGIREKADLKRADK